MVEQTQNQHVGRGALVGLLSGLVTFAFRALLAAGDALRSE